MVVGIRFAADVPVRTVLQAVLPIFSTADVDFLVREYWVCTFGNGLPERRFTAQEMRRALDALTPDEHAELFTIYVLPHNAPGTPPSSCEDFCARGFTMAFYAYDGDGYALLAQSEEQVRGKRWKSAVWKLLSARRWRGGTFEQLINSLPFSRRTVFPNIDKQTYEKRLPMAKKNIKAVMDELTAMAQDKNTAPRAFADSFQAHSAELRAVFFPDTPMKMPETHDDTEESSQECVTCFCEFLAKCTSADDQNCPVTIVVSAHELPTVSVQTISGAKVIFDDLYACRSMDEDTRGRFRELEALWGENSEDGCFVAKFCEKLKASLPAIFASTIEIKRNS